jgi:hypothetical protein
VDGERLVVLLILLVGGTPLGKGVCSVARRCGLLFAACLGCALASLLPSIISLSSLVAWQSSVECPVSSLLKTQYILSLHMGTHPLPLGPLSPLADY